MNSEFLGAISGTASCKQAFPPVKVAQGNRRLCDSLCTAGWQKGCAFLLLRCDWHNHKGLISFSYSFLVVFTCPPEINHAEVFRIVMGLGQGVQCLKILSANELYGTWKLSQSFPQFGAEHILGILNKLFIHPDVSELDIDGCWTHVGLIYFMYSPILFQKVALLNSGYSWLPVFRI